MQQAVRNLSQMQLMARMYVVVRNEVFMCCRD
jgi:hypothetical protein